MIADQSGSLAGVKRHDYLPFGEEIGGSQVALIGGRTTTQGYTSDGVRQHFTGYESDAETGLNFAQARYQSPTQGRFINVDRLGARAILQTAPCCALNLSPRLTTENEKWKLEG